MCLLGRRWEGIEFSHKNFSPLLYQLSYPVLEPAKARTRRDRSRAATMQIPNGEARAIDARLIFELAY